MADLDLDAIASRPGDGAIFLSNWERDALVAEVRRLRAIEAAADHMAAENESAARRVTGEAGEARGGVQPQSATPDAEVRRLRAIEDMARFVLAEHDNANTRHKAGGNALGHCHRNPPKWDDRDAVCTWCVSVATLRHTLEADRG